VKAPLESCKNYGFILAINVLAGSHGHILYTL
jgi:hypothetical protein